MRAAISSAFRGSGATKQFHELELALLDPEVRGTPGEMEQLLHDEFIELGSSGNLYGRAEMLSMINGEESAKVVIRDFETHKVGPDSVLVTYRSIGQGGNEARRSSLWVRDDGRWKIRFHQGTRIANSWGRVS